MNARPEFERSRPPFTSSLLAWAAIAPLVVAAALAAIGGLHLTLLGLQWCGAILCFFAGVRRGLSFHDGGGLRAVEIAASLWIFACGFVTLLISGSRLAAYAAIVGLASIAAVDWSTASQGADTRDPHGSPRYFGRLRPLQMVVAIASVTALEYVRG